MEAGLASDEVAVVVEGDASLGDDGVEVGEGVEVPVDDGFVDVDPEGLGGLQLRGVGRQVDEADAFGDGEPGAVCQPAPSRTRMMIRSRPAPASRAKSARVSSKSSLSTPVERYQKLSPVAGETKAVT